MDCGHCKIFFSRDYITLTCEEIKNNNDEHGAGIYHEVHLDSFQNGDTKESNSDDDYVDSLDLPIAGC